MSLSDERGQAITLEAIAAGLILLSSVVFALQMTAVTPLSASTSSQHIENQLEASAEGVLATSVEDGSLKRAILFYNESSSEFINATDDGYSGSPPDNAFGDRLQWAFDRRGIAYNIRITYKEGNGRWLYYRGEPSDNAVTASTFVVITDDTPMYNDTDNDGVAEPRSVNVSETLPGSSYMSDVSSGELYNVARIEVTVWRI